jgi:hypothetical protein
MINANTRGTDQYDVAVLLAAMVKAEDLASDAFDTSLVQIGYDEALLRCRIAAAVLARDHVEQGDEWDGCVWLEVLAAHTVGVALFLGGVTGDDLLPHERIDRVADVMHAVIRAQQGAHRVTQDPLPAY